ncbi:helix-turn-helix domain-containing protein [Salmonella enterica subsp. enterica serovar Newport]|nr:hypothetical protein [Salmonella enterica subsp. enterica serovar Newport]EAB9314111.1 helix-turn-helix domain-containing protein [Salmonella enterica subsp. enterica serovar Typhimurium]EAP1717154.1 helix-turn-helix domain-containing protein [Salmonella enterica]ECA1878894.1 helix-turn-helix domain-containing protein [Salmonella enterica subsp. enterica serovar Napoli]EDV5409841.1 helix-turn-helix domain-containing protein [Salmonella enterica subsp. enterica]EHK8785484.1 helix-turn-helix 
MYVLTEGKRIFTILQLAEWLEHNLHREITIAELEKKTGYSARHLYTFFTDRLGISVTRYIRRRRLTLASVMLRETSRSVTEIALMYQFNHLQTFSRAFRKQFGQSPQQYRRAQAWDMQHYYPSAAVKKIRCKPRLAGVNQLRFFPVDHVFYRINFGYDFLVTTKNEKINAYPEVYQDCIDFIFRNHIRQPLVVFGELLPGKKSDTEINIYSGYFTAENRPGIISVPCGYYLCFTSTDTPAELMKFFSWAKGHGMHSQGTIMKRGPTFTVFTATGTTDIYKAEHYIPCVNPHSTATPE